MENKKGISLITLIITIVVIVILAAAIIISLTKTNIIENSNDAVEINKKGVATDEINLATYDLFVEENKKQMTQEEKRAQLENNLKEYDSSTTVELTETGFIANHRGYAFEISDKYEIAIKENGGAEEEKFDAAEWDKDATPDHYFEWDEAGTTIIGYSDSLTGNEKIRIPSKCIAIKPNEIWVGSSNREQIASGVKKVELPETITSIGDYAFSYFKDLQQINIPNNVKNIGKGAFYWCQKLESINIPNSITTINDDTFNECFELKNITMSENIITIGNKAFHKCTSLENITIPDSVTSIGDSAFVDCGSLISIVIPESVINVGSIAFAGWNSNQTINCEISSKPDGWHSGWNSQQWGQEIPAKIVWGYTGE